jgi:hypothetical protein
LVDVSINGSATDSGSGVASTVVTVSDEYGIYNMTGLSLGDVIKLEASREGADGDGRQYTITAVTTDNAGNQSTATTTVLVPHDMDEKNDDHEKKNNHDREDDYDEKEDHHED